MSKTKPKSKSGAKSTQKPAERLTTCAVRFAATPEKIYTYKVKRGRVKLGDELIADTPRGPAVVFVVRLDANAQPVEGVELKTITRKAVPI